MLGLIDILGARLAVASVVEVVDVDRCLPKGLNLVLTFTDFSVTTVVSSVVLLWRTLFGTNLVRSVVSDSSWL